MTTSPPDFWIVLSLAAAGFQTLRFALQKILATRLLSPTGATFARFLYSAPVIVVAMMVYLHRTGQSLPMPTATFWGFAAVGGVSQVLATICVVRLFATRNFAVGVALHKTEVVLSVFVGIVFLSETVSAIAFAAILAGLAGAFLLSKTPGTQLMSRAGLFNASAGLGLAAGALFAISSVSYRGASLEVASVDAVVRAGLTLAAVTSMQTVGMTLWLGMRDPAQLRAVLQARRVAVWIGLLSLAGSFCWFMAFTLQTAAYVKAVGQIELIFGLLVSVFFFSERISRRELAGIFVLGASILVLVLAA